MMREYIIAAVALMAFGVYGTYMLYVMHKTYTELFKLRMFIIADRIKRQEEKMNDESRSN